jgi:outer membrane protein TolC
MPKRILVILGHPRTASFCGALADAYAEGAKAGGHEVRVISLGSLSFDPILHNGYAAVQPLEPDLVAAQAAILDVTRQVRDAVRSLQTLAQSIQASSESVRLATVNLDTERRKLQVGSSTAFEVQRRNQDLLEARTRLLRNQLDFRTAQSRLLHAQGLLKAEGE